MIFDLGKILFSLPNDAKALPTNVLVLGSVFCVIVERLQEAHRKPTVNSELIHAHKQHHY